MKAINNIPSLGLLMLVLTAATGGASSAAAVAAAVATPTCQPNQPGKSVTDAQSAITQNPGELAPHLRLANALIDQGCYEQAAAALEAALKQYPRNAEVMGKLRDVRSMLTEQTYIQNVTQAEDAARLQHDQLRCSKLADLDACNAVLKVLPGDPTALAAKANAAADSRVSKGSGLAGPPTPTPTPMPTPALTAAAPTAAPPPRSAAPPIRVASSSRRANITPPSPHEDRHAQNAILTPAAPTPTFSNSALAGRTN